MKENFVNYFEGFIFLITLLEYKKINKIIVQTHINEFYDTIMIQAIL
jgi:hypothetical protein